MGFIDDVLKLVFKDLFANFMMAVGVILLIVGAGKKKKSDDEIKKCSSDDPKYYDECASKIDEKTGARLLLSGVILLVGGAGYKYYLRNMN